MKKKIKSIANNEKWMETLFVLLILSFPFGSFFLSFSIGFMTIYPYLVLVCLLTFLGFFKTNKIDTRLEKVFLYFLIFFFVYALAFLPFVGGKKDAIIDLRSIALMMMTSYVFISVSKVLGFERWKSVLLFSFKLIFFMLVFFAVFEMLTEFHFVGTFTDKLIKRGLHDIINAGPVFLWDNPNNFNGYVFLIGFVIILLESSARGKSQLKWLILSICFFCSFIVESRVGMAVSLFVIGVMLMRELFLFFRQSFEKRIVYFVLFVSGALGYALLTTEIFYEIPEDKVKVYTDYVLKNPPPVVEVVPAPVILINDSVISGINEIVSHNEIVSETKPTEDAIKKVEQKNVPYRNSESERMALILNGVDFIFQSKFLGVGPGQYRYLHDTGQIQHYAYGNNGAHFWFLELVSQFGLIIFLPYIGLLFWIFFLAMKNRKSNPELALYIFLGLVCFVGVSIMPSSFLIRDINWIFIVILVVLVSNYSIIKSEKADV